MRRLRERNRTQRRQRRPSARLDAHQGQVSYREEHLVGEVLILMPLETETYHANAKKCEDRAKDMPPELRRDLLMAARHWRKLASVADKRDLKTERSGPAE